MEYLRVIVCKTLLIKHLESLEMSHVVFIFNQGKRTSVLVGLVRDFN